MVYDANVDPIDQGWINVYFFFDREGHLVGYLVHPFVPEPRRSRWSAPPPGHRPEATNPFVPQPGRSR
jgi:hypothetical protein